MEITLRKMISNGLIDYLAWALFKIAVLVMLIPVYHWIWMRWTEYESYYSHGPLVVLLSLFLIWKETKVYIIRPIPKILSQARWIKLLLLSLVVLVYLVACLIKVYFLIALSVWAIFFVVLWASFEMEVFRRLRFALGFLVLAVPLPMVLSEQIALILKSVSAKVAGKILTVIGITTKVVGNRLYTPYAVLEVGAPCSGLRSIVSLFTLAVLFAYLNRMSYKRAIVLVGASPLVAFLGNIIRVFSLGFVADIYGSKIALGRFHDVLGYLVFGLDLMILFAISKALSWRGK